MQFRGLSIDRLNVGCGNDLHKGWLNIDLFPENQIPYGHVGIHDGMYALSWDMTKDLMLPKDSIKYIYSSHFIEHLTLYDAVKFFETCYSILEPSGIMRISCPDLELWIDNYTKNNMDFFNEYKRMFLKGGVKDIPKTKGEIFMASLFLWQHKWGYDFESLKDLLGRVGFRNIIKTKRHEGKMEDLKRVEPKSKERLLESLYVEAQK